MTRVRKRGRLETLANAILELTRELRRYNDTHEPVRISGSVRVEAELGRAIYGESDAAREHREALRQLEAEARGGGAGD